jgi:hypothetical protein
MNFPSSSPATTPDSQTLAQSASSLTRPPAKLHLLREHDPLRHWNALADNRVCLLCGSEFTGAEIRVRARNGKPVFECPEAGCPASLTHFVYSGNPLLSEAVWSDWMQVKSKPERID